MFPDPVGGIRMKFLLILALACSLLGPGATCKAQGFGNTAGGGKPSAEGGAFGNVNPAWTQRYAHGNAFFEIKSMTVEAQSGDIIAIGEQQLDAISGLLTTDGSRMSQIHLRRFDRGGGQMWNIPHVGTANQPNRADAVMLGPNGATLILGHYGPIRKARHFLIKAGIDGKESSKRLLGQAGWSIKDVHATPDGGFLLSGSIPLPGPGYAQATWLLKLDATGDYVGEAKFDDVDGKVVAVRPDGALLFYGRPIVNGRFGPDNILALLDAQGSQQWRRSIQLPDADGDSVALHQFHLRPDGGLLALGSALDLSSKNKRRKARLAVGRIASDGNLEHIELRPTAFESVSVMALAPGNAKGDVVVGIYGQTTFGDRGDGVLLSLDAQSGAEKARQELPQLLINSMLRHPDGSLLVAGREITSFSVDRRGNYHESANGVIAKLNGP